MRTIVKGKNVEVPDRVREYAERKLKRLERLLDDQTDATLELWIEHHKSAADTHIAELTLVVHGQIMRSRAAGSTYQAALDDVVDKAERQAVEHKEKAVSAMEELGHQFFVFVNAETERVAILYRRNDGDYGLIEPVVGGDYTQGRSHAPSAPERTTQARA